jgi:hypothetical protein
MFAIFSCGVCVCCCYEKKRSAANYYDGRQDAENKAGIRASTAIYRDSNLSPPPPQPMEPVQMPTGYHSPHNSMVNKSVNRSMGSTGGNRSMVSTSGVAGADI